MQGRGGRRRAGLGRYGVGRSIAVQGGAAGGGRAGKGAGGVEGRDGALRVKAWRGEARRGWRCFVVPCGVWARRGWAVSDVCA